jgi:hypothetical protein
LNEIASSHCLPQGPDFATPPNRLQQGFAMRGMGFNGRFARSKILGARCPFGSLEDIAASRAPCPLYPPKMG